MATTSQWRREARNYITTALALLPENATEKEARAAVREAYPWGLRQHHPYRMWCLEAKAALAERFPKPKEPEKEMAVRFAFWHEKRRWWLTVQCDWCRSIRHSPGVSTCLACGAYHAIICHLVNRPEWPDWLRDLSADPEAAPLVLADWLSEQGYPEALAELFRAEGKWKEAAPCPND